MSQPFSLHQTNCSSQPKPCSNTLWSSFERCIKKLQECNGDVGVALEELLSDFLQIDPDTEDRGGSIQEILIWVKIWIPIPFQSQKESSKELKKNQISIHNPSSWRISKWTGIHNSLFWGINTALFWIWKCPNSRIWRGLCWGGDAERREDGARVDLRGRFQGWINTSCSEIRFFLALGKSCVSLFDWIIVTYTVWL